MAPEGVEIRLTSSAATELAELGPRRRGMLTIELGHRAQGPLDPGLRSSAPSSTRGSRDLRSGASFTTG